MNDNGNWDKKIPVQTHGILVTISQALLVIPLKHKQRTELNHNMLYMYTMYLLSLSSSKDASTPLSLCARP